MEEGFAMIRLEDEEEGGLMYEAPTFCFICGFMGHNEKFCEKIFDTSLESIENPYGIWMHAEPRRRNHTIGTKWLRQGNIYPITNSSETKEDRSEKVGTEIVAGSKDDPMKSGIAEDSRMKIMRVNSGNSYVTNPSNAYQLVPNSNMLTVGGNFGPK
ncbi:hypothetical protein POM88_007841 [Heracleum sosnowskyi]|uniref:Zinc knuckle CX2CX4HX4C domain-containing protein n=1 Tax=Heracleum sosnowskyi TaxID=360622 RepID=A0AAD8J7J7_9APIA|nr:hypothetical protein POM88_007841 [Heracleum sosnowskyi]